MRKEILAEFDEQQKIVSMEADRLHEENVRTLFSFSSLSTSSCASSPPLPLYSR
jgi:hypothetical protein